jgi:hypothetical protein
VAGDGGFVVMEVLAFDHDFTMPVLVIGGVVLAS